MIAFVAKDPATSYQLPILVLAHLVHGYGFPSVVIEIGQFFDDGRLNESLRQDALGVLVLVNDLEQL